MVNELSLFSGAGGGLLGTKLLGWKHVGYVEWNEYCQRVIAARIADGYLDSAPIFTDVREFVQSGAAEQYRGIADVVSAGFPCQPFSVAGKQAGADDERNMWPATVEVIRRVQPQSVLLENVPGLVSCGYIGTVLADLANLGYVGRWGVLGASDVGAPHRRKRLWIVANAKCSTSNLQSKFYVQRRWQEQAKQAGMGSYGKELADSSSKHGDGVCNYAGIRMESSEVPELGNGSRETIMAYPYRPQCQGVRQSIRVQPEHSDACGASIGWWDKDPADDIESNVGRMAPRVAHGMDRLKAIGNGQVSAVVAEAWRRLA